MLEFFLKILPKPVSLHPAEIFSKKEGKIETFSDIQKLAVYITSKFTLQNILKKVIQAKRNHNHVKKWNKMY